MTLKESIAADLSVFVNIDEFAYDAVYSRSGVTVSVLIDKEQEAETGRFVDYITAKSSDITGISPGDTFTLTDTGEVYVAAASVPLVIGDGFTMMRVDKI